MTYNEIAKKLNEMYNTDIFFIKCGGDLTPEDFCLTYVNLPGIDDVQVEVDPTTLRIKSFFCHQTVDGNSLAKIGVALKSLSEYEKQCEIINNLNLKLENMQTTIGVMQKEFDALNGVKDFAQDTILKAIKG